MIHKLAHALAMKQHGIVFPSNMVHVSTYPLALAALSAPKQEKKHSSKWDDCVSDVKKKGKGYDPYAVCTAQLGQDSYEADSGSSFPGALRDKGECECET